MKKQILTTLVLVSLSSMAMAQSLSPEKLSTVFQSGDFSVETDKPHTEFSKVDMCCMALERYNNGEITIDRLNAVCDENWKEDDEWSTLSMDSRHDDCPFDFHSTGRGVIIKVDSEILETIRDKNQAEEYIDAEADEPNYELDYEGSDSDYNYNYDGDSEDDETNTIKIESGKIADGIDVINPLGLTCCEAIDKYQDGNMSQERAMDICGLKSEMLFAAKISQCAEISTDTQGMKIKI